MGRTRNLSVSSNDGTLNPSGKNATLTSVSRIPAPSG
jgi:hypothetical protein